MFVIIGLAGAIGTGKSWTMLHQMLQYANDKRKNIVFNFNIDVQALAYYASLPKWYDSPFAPIYVFLHAVVKGLKQSLDLVPSVLWYVPVHFLLAFFLNLCRLILIVVGAWSSSPRLPWIQHLCRVGGIFCIPAPKLLEALFIPESVVALDEAGILLNARDFASTSKQLLADLAQSRKDGCDLFWAAQFEEQVDRQVRLLTQYWIHCDSFSAYDKKLRRPKLVWKRFYWFRAADYFHWLNNPKDRTSHFKARFAYAFKYVGGTLTLADRYLFNVFRSFDRLDVARGGFMVSRERCMLPKDYYFKRLSCYHPARDPLSSNYQPFYGFYSLSRRFPQTEQLVSDRSSLIRRALEVARKTGQKAPYFKSMPDLEIHRFISSNS